MDKKETVDVTVLVDDSHRGDMAAVARKLEDKGFVVNQSLDEIGVLTGSAPAHTLTALSAIPGVSAVERNRTDFRPQ
jgi:hypothetical protein